MTPDGPYAEWTAERRHVPIPDGFAERVVAALEVTPQAPAASTRNGSGGLPRRWWQFAWARAAAVFFCVAVCLARLYLVMRPFVD